MPTSSIEDEDIGVQSGSVSSSTSSIKMETESQDITATTQQQYKPFFSAFKGCNEYLIISGSVLDIVLSSGCSHLPILILEKDIDAVENSNSGSDIGNLVASSSLFVYAAFGGGLVAIGYVYCWTLNGEQQCAKMREDLKAKSTQGESSSDCIAQVLERISLIQYATGEKAGKFILLMANFINCFIIASTKAPLLSLIVFIFYVTLVALVAYIKFISRRKLLADEKTIPSSTTDYSIRRVPMLQKSCKYAIIERVLEGSFDGFCVLILFCGSAFQLWLGEEMGYSNTESTVALLSTVIGFMSLCLALSYFSTFAAGRDAANKMSDETIRREDPGQMVIPQGSHSDPLNEESAQPQADTDQEIVHSDYFGSLLLLSPSPSTSSRSSATGSSHRSISSYAAFDNSRRMMGSEQETPPKETNSTDQEGIPKPKVSLRRRAYNLNFLELCHTIPGMLSSALIGFIMPISGLMLSSKIIDFYYMPDEQPEQQQHWKYLPLLGLFSLLLHAVRSYCFTKADWELMNRILFMSFEKVETMNISGFQKEALVARLYTDAALVKGLVGDDLSFHSQNLGSAFPVLLISGFVNWKFALAPLLFYTALGLNWYVQNKLMQKLRRDAKGGEAQYALISSIGFGISVFLFFIMMATVFGLVEAGHVDKRHAPKLLFRMLLSTAMGMLGLVVSASYSYEIAKAEAGAAYIFNFLYGETNIDPVEDGSGMNLSNENSDTDIEFGGDAGFNE